MFQPEIDTTGRFEAKQFHVAHQTAADNAVWTVVSPEGTTVWRTTDLHEARRVRDLRNGTKAWSQA